MCDGADSGLRPDVFASSIKCRTVSTVTLTSDYAGEQATDRQVENAERSRVEMTMRARGRK